MPLMNNRVMASLMSRASAVPALARAAVAAMVTGSAATVMPNKMAHTRRSLKRRSEGDGKCNLNWDSGIKKRMRHARRFGRKPSEQVVKLQPEQMVRAVHRHIHPRHKRGAA